VQKAATKRENCRARVIDVNNSQACSTAGENYGRALRRSFSGANALKAVSKVIGEEIISQEASRAPG